MLINWFLKTPVKDTDFSILTIRTLYSLPVCLYSIYVNATNTDLTGLIQAIGITTIVDCVFSEGSIMIHHVLSLVFVGSYLFSTAIHGYDFACRAVIASEYSTIFLLIQRWLDHYSIDSTANKMAFFAAFTWFRIVKFYSQVIVNDALYDDLSFPLFWSVSGVLAFYFLNLYWFALIIKKVYNKVAREFLEKKQHAIEHLLQYTYAPNLILCFYLYITADRHYTPFYYIIDILGVQNLVFSSYDYHRVLKETHLDHDSPQVIRYYWYDIASIKLRFFLPLVTLLFSGRDTFFFVIASSTINVTTFYFITCFNKPSQFTFFYRAVLLGVPIIIDTLFIGSFSLNTPSRIAEILVCLTCVIITYSVKPMNQLSQLLIHAFSLWQTSIFCRIISATPPP
jgi:hypothetical protein